MNVFCIGTCDGVFTAFFSESGLARLEFPSGDQRKGQTSVFGKGALLRKWLRLTTTALERALRGLPAETLPPLDLSSGTDFQQAVWKVLSRISPKQPITYTEVAVAIGRPKAVRAVGQACGANPIPVFIPCHRVLAAGGRLGGFSGGLHWKIRLLEREGFEVGRRVELA